VGGAPKQHAAIMQIVESLATALANVTIEQLRAQCDV